MALCLAESLVEKRSFDARDQMKRYRRWFREGYLSSTGEAFGYGATVKRALDRFDAWGIPYVGDSSDLGASNGSLMRVAPIPMFFALIQPPPFVMHVIAPGRPMPMWWSWKPVNIWPH